jgi:hypothetical protein
LDPCGPNALIVVPQAVPKENGPYHLDFFADTADNNHMYDGIGSVTTNDHAWRRNLTDKENVPQDTRGATATPNAVTINFVHDTIFTDIDVPPNETSKSPSVDPGGDALVQLSGMAPFLNNLVELKLKNAQTAQTVGLYRFTNPSTDDLSAKFKGIVDITTLYNLEVYIDSNQNGVYDDPSMPNGDLGWRIPVTSAADGGGVRFSFSPSMSNSNIAVGPVGGKN